MLCRFVAKFPPLLNEWRHQWNIFTCLKMFHIFCSLATISCIWTFMSQQWSFMVPRSWTFYFFCLFCACVFCMCTTTTTAAAIPMHFTLTTLPSPQHVVIDVQPFLGLGATYSLSLNAFPVLVKWSPNSNIFNVFLYFRRSLDFSLPYPCSLYFDGQCIATESENIE